MTEGVTRTPRLRKPAHVLDEREAQHVAEERPGCVGVVGVDERVAGEDHPFRVPPTLTRVEA